LKIRKKYLQSEGKFDRIIKSFGETPENEGKNNLKNFLTNHFESDKLMELRLTEAKSRTAL